MLPCTADVAHADLAGPSNPDSQKGKADRRRSQPAGQAPCVNIREVPMSWACIWNHTTLSLPAMHHSLESAVLVLTLWTAHCPKCLVRSQTTVCMQSTYRFSKCC